MRRRQRSCRAGSAVRARASSTKPARLYSPAVSVDPVEEAVDARRAVVEPPGAAEQHRGIVAGERRKLAAVGALVEREENDREARVVAARLEQRSQAARPVGRDRDVRADVAPEPLRERAVVVSQAADVKLHHEAVVAAHPRELVEHVRLEPPRVGVRGLARERAANSADASRSVRREVSALVAA